MGICTPLVNREAFTLSHFPLWGVCQTLNRESQRVNWSYWPTTVVQRKFVLHKVHRGQAWHSFDSLAFPRQNFSPTPSCSSIVCFQLGQIIQNGALKSTASTTPLLSSAVFRFFPPHMSIVCICYTLLCITDRNPWELMTVTSCLAAGQTRAQGTFL